jgi:hypothetical protein
MIILDGKACCGRRPSGLLAGDLLRLPHTLAGLCVETTKLAVAAQPVDVVALDDRRGDDGDPSCTAVGTVIP